MCIRDRHQQAARIVDHRFSTFTAMQSFARDAKKAGVSILMLVSVQKTSRCPGPWYNGLQLCDHINGSYPIEDGHGDPGSLAEWQWPTHTSSGVRMLRDLRLDALLQGHRGREVSAEGKPRIMQANSTCIIRGLPAQSVG